ncbi:MAG: sensor histidine kinase, partial [Acidimicrobiia bacterium]
MVPVAVLGALAVALAVALVISHRAQQKLTRRLLDVGRRLDPDVQPSGPSLDDAAAVVERAVERTLVRGSDVSVSEGRLVRALGALPLGVVVFDESGDVVARNDEAARFVAARHSEALVEEAIGELGARALGGTAASRTVDLFGPPRRILVLESVPLDLEGRRVGALVVVDDVSERRRLEAVRRDFVANISHELKTPVGALALLAETLLAEDDPVVSRRLSERMLSEAFRVGRTIDDLLELSRIEAEEHAVRQPTPVDLILAEAVDRVAPAAERSAITIEVSEPPGRPTVVGDRRQLVSATYNLLENAVKYSDKGSSVEIEAAAVDGW